jgi:membrane-associated phospholipid phosphatase
MQAPSQPAPAAPATAMPPARQKRHRLLFVLLLLVSFLISLYLVLWLYQLLLSQFDVAAPAIAVPLGALILALVGPWLLMHNEARVRSALGGVMRAVWRAVARTPLAHALARRFPGVARQLRRLFSTSPAAGLLLIAVLFAASAVVWFFLVLLAQVVTGGGITGTDTRVINLVTTLRTPAVDHVFYAITLFGSAETIAVVAGTAILFTLLRAHYEDGLMILLAVAAGTGFFALIKVLVHRPRPPLEDAVYVQSGFSFPSGHSTVSAALYGTLAYLVIRGMRSEAFKAVIGTLAALLVFAIGFSRVYLGVHYPSDVVAGWAAGIFWVLLVVAAEDVWPPVTREPLPRAWRIADVVTTMVLLGLGGTYLVYNDLHLPPSPVVAPPAPQVIADTAVVSQVEGDLPHYTESIFGGAQEPVSLVFVGSRGELEAAFRAAGWTEASPFGLGSTAGAFAAGLTGQSDAAGPVTPSFLGDEPNALAFNLPLGNTFAQRHHIRLWTTGVETSTGQPVWEATASLDEGFELSPSTGFPTHHINPDIDAERTFVVTTLAGAGRIEGEQAIQLVPPEQGHNFAGDPFFTDGQAIVLDLVTESAG